MKLDVNVLRYLSKEDFRVLTAVEMGQKNVSQGGGLWVRCRRRRARHWLPCALSLAGLLHCCFA